MEAAAPLIVTVQLDETTFALFNTLRQKYFPPERNFLSAHLTLFHHLPAGEFQMMEDLQRWSETASPLNMRVTEVKNIGKGVAYKIDCPLLVQLHRQMQERWQQWLTPQDKQKLWPHVTVQNKVSAADAQQTFKTLSTTFQPFAATGIGFHLWTYEGGPWKAVQTFPFRRS
jgi:hypothetical protein